MNFKFYDILSHLVPGFLVYIIGLHSLDIAFDQDYIIPATAIAYIIGYFINTLSSWLEDFFYWTWGGTPSDKLLDGKGTWKINFYEHEKAKRLLKEECDKEMPKNKELFGIAMRYANSEINSRVQDFNAMYAFSRVILTSLILALGLLIYKYHDSSNLYITFLPLIFIAWLRCKQRGYYYSREVLYTYLKSKTKNS